MQFFEVVGHSGTKAHLVQMAENNRIPHALMLNGQEGAGTLPLAMAMAQYIMCTQKQNNDSCVNNANACPSCQKNYKMQHPDVHFCYPTVSTGTAKPSTSAEFIKQFREAVLKNAYLNIQDWLLALKADNKQANITAQETREIITKLRLRAYEGGYKILIMWLPEYLGKEGNMLLKLIEEPPANTIIIFATESYQRILPTIQSRVQLVQLSALADETIKTHLVQKGFAEALSLQAARMAAGSYREALLLLQDTESDYYPIARDWFNNIFTNNGPGILQWVAKTAENGKEQNKLLLNYIINLMGYMVHIKNGAATNVLLQANEEQLLQKLIVKNVDEYMAEQIATICTEAIVHIERNINTKIILHAITLKAKDIFSAKALYL